MLDWTVRAEFWNKQRDRAERKMCTDIRQFLSFLWLESVMLILMNFFNNIWLFHVMNYFHLFWEISKVAGVELMWEVARLIEVALRLCTVVSRSFATKNSLHWGATPSSPCLRLKLSCGHCTAQSDSTILWCGLYIAGYCIMYQTQDIQTNDILQHWVQCILPFCQYPLVFSQ